MSVSTLASFAAVAALLACASGDGVYTCQYEGKWFADGDVVVTREICLHCTCVRGAMSCRRRTCAPLPDPPSPRCYTHHRRDSCCPELHCPEGTIFMERGAYARFDEDLPDMASTISVGHVCSEGGTVYAAGSAMSSNMACEQCFCLGGARRCVRPKCLPPPDGCQPRPAPGVCCPQRYYCEHASTRPPGEKHLHDCKVDGNWISEGERVTLPSLTNCSHCFCLRGSVRCQHLACAPPILGCKPLLQPGQCCPHQYQCEHQKRGTGLQIQPLTSNALNFVKNEDRSFHNSDNKEENLGDILTSTDIDKTTFITTSKKDSITTTKVKRKTSEPPSNHGNENKEKNITTTTMKTTPQDVQNNATTLTMEFSSNTNTPTEVTTIETSLDESTEQPEGSIKIMINGTINCTAELSSSTIVLNETYTNGTEKFESDTQPRIPNVDTVIESQTFNPNDIITDRNYNEDFDENESFTINVTSSLTGSLRTNSTSSTTLASHTKPLKPLLIEPIVSHNISKKTKDDYNYNYEKPTLPPSLPNLKIIPFVAADAVVEDDIAPKETLTYPILDREDKYPVYYPSVESKDIPFVTRKEDLYHPTQYPIFLSKKVNSMQYPISANQIHITNEYPSITSDIITSLHEYAVTASLENNIHDSNKVATKLPDMSTKFDLENPSVNLFSPPMETEGGFIPKSPGLIDDYYAVYPSTPPGSIVPHLTTSMQLDTSKGDCISGDGRRVLEGETISLSCSICTCAWGDLHCSQRPCHTPLGCSRRPAKTNSADLCCGDLVCDQGNKTTPTPSRLSTRSVTVAFHKTKPPVTNKTQTNTDSILTKNNTVISLQSVNTTENDVYKITRNTSSNERGKINNTVSTPTETQVNSDVTPNVENIDITGNNSQEYDEDEDDEGFSFGSVLKLLLSDSYETTTAAPPKKTTTLITKPSAPITSTPMVVVKKQTLRPSMNANPVTHRLPYMPPKKLQQQNTINRIDHLILGESTAIKRTTIRPTPVTFKPIPSRKPFTTKKPATQRPDVPTKPLEATRKSEQGQHSSVSQESIRVPSVNTLGGIGSGILKLAGCNIYGQMYRIGRIIVELTTACQECRCTEVGVQCRPLNC